MDTSQLNHAYRTLLDAANGLTEDDPLSEAARADVDWTLAHLALSDRLLASTARSILAARPGELDNTAAMSPQAIAALVDATSHFQRVDMVRRNAAELTALLERIPYHHGTTPVSVRLVDRAGSTVFTGNVPWGEIVRRRAQDQLPGHTARLLGLHRTAVSDSEETTP
ncbi:hypothetical protein P3T37_001219 [Kitasatospora sp. MAA4]|uniref:hypothetical protein n=1 Tax=Kitasatospora sp. MAA4 TaxID=3035093 RepID=UPI0024750D41|nr:hypothetical protein [Kitasatospora sp. MAA4]MDH6131845.1 hypothetical protein [Kitasatospora sp. MAA4]